jgi:hypothetical protein
LRSESRIETRLCELGEERVEIGGRKRHQQLLAHADADGPRYLLDALQACRGVPVGLVALYLLLFEIEAVGKVFLAKAGRNTRLD